MFSKGEAKDTDQNNGDKDNDNEKGSAAHGVIVLMMTILVMAWNLTLIRQR